MRVENDISLSNSWYFTVDRNHHDRIDVVCEGTGTLTLLLYGFYEYGEYYSLTPYTILTTSIDGWGKNTILEKNLSTLEIPDEVRFLGMPIVMSDGEVIVKLIEARSSNDETNIPSDQEDLTSVGLVGSGLDFFEDFDYYDDTVWSLQSSSSFSDDFNNGVINDAWDMGYIEGPYGSSQWTIAETGGELKIQCNTKGMDREKYGAWQEVNWTEDFEVEVRAQRHDIYYNMLREVSLAIYDTNDTLMALCSVYDAWAYNDAYRILLYFYDNNGDYLDGWYEHHYPGDYNAYRTFKIDRIDGTVNLYENDVEKIDCNMTGRTVGKVALYMRNDTSYFQNSAYATFDNFSMDESSEGTVELTEGSAHIMGGILAPTYTTDSDNLLINFTVQLQGSSDAFAFHFGDNWLEYSSDGSSNLYLGSMVIDSSSAHPITNSQLSTVKITKNHDRIVIWVDGGTFLSGNSNGDISTSPYTFSWESLGTAVYIDNIAIIECGENNGYSSSAIQMNLPLDEGAGSAGTAVHDTSGNANNGTLRGTPEWNDNELYLDGDYINLPNDIGYHNEVSAFAWFKSRGSPIGGFHIIFGGQELEISISESTGALRTGVVTDSRNRSDHGSGLLDGKWHHVGFTFDGVTKKSYIDGQFVGELTGITGTLVSSFSDRRIGKFGSSSNYLNGYLKDAIILGKALDNHEVSRLFVNGASNILYSMVIDSPPVASYDLTTPISDPTEDNNYFLYDISEHGVQNNTDAVTASFDETESCYHFDGVDDWIDIPDDASLRLNDSLTVAAWIKADNLPSWASIVVGESSEQWYSWALRVNNDSKLQFVMALGSSWEGATNTTDLPIGEWVHVVGTWNQATNIGKLYVDGTNVDSFRNTDSLKAHNQGVHIGVYSYEDIYWNGYIASVQIFDYALSYEEILSLYGSDSVLRSGATAIYDHPLNTSESWTISTDIGIPQGVTGDILEVQVNGERSSIVATDNGDETVTLNMTAVPSTAAGDGFEAGPPLSNGWSVVVNPSGSVFEQDTTYTRSGTYSGHHDGTTDYRWDEWPAVGTFEAFDFEGWVYHTGSTYGVSRFYYYVDSQNWVYVRFYQYEIWCYKYINGQQTKVFEVDLSPVGSWPNKWFWIHINFIEGGSGNDSIFVEYRQDGYEVQSVGTFDLGTNYAPGMFQLGSRISHGDYWYDDFSITTSEVVNEDLCTIDYSGTSDLKLSMDLTETQGTFLLDQSAYGNNGISFGSPALTGSMGVMFDGDNDYISVADAPGFDNQDAITLAAWIYPTVNMPYGCLVSKRDAWLLGSDNNNHIRFDVFDGPYPNYHVITTTDTVPLNQWSHVVAVYDNNSNLFKVYINGVEKASTSTDYGAINNDAGPIHIGKDENYSSERNFTGYMRNVQIWNRALGEDEISTISGSFLLNSNAINSNVLIELTTTGDGNLLVNAGGTETIIEGFNTSVLEFVKVLNQADRNMFTNTSFLDNTSYYITNSMDFAKISLVSEGADNAMISENVVSGELNDAGDIIGVTIPLGDFFTGGTTGYYSVDVKPSIKDASLYSYTDLYVTLVESNIVCLEYAIRDFVENPTPVSPSGQIGNNQWTTLVFSSLDYTTDQDIRIYIQSGTGRAGETTFEIGDIQTLEKMDLPSNMNEFIPSGHYSSTGNKDQFVYVADGKYVLENRVYYPDAIDEEAYIGIDFDQRVWPESRIEFSWKINQPEAADVGVGIILECGNSQRIWVSLNGVTTAPSVSGITAKYILTDFAERGEWHTFSMTIGELLSRCTPSLTLSSIDEFIFDVRIVIDEHGESEEYRLTVEDVVIERPTTPLLANASRRVGNVQESGFYIKEWLASPMYKLYSPNLPKTDLAPDGSFEEERWLYTADDYNWGTVDPPDSYYDTENPHSGTQSLKLYPDEELLMEIELLYTSSYIDLLFDFWVRGNATFLKFGFMHSASTWVNGYPTNGTYSYSYSGVGSVSEWTHVQLSFNFSYWGEFVYMWFINESSSNVNIDDVQVKPFLPLTSEYNPSESQMGRTFDPSNVNRTSFLDGWYELSLDGINSNYVSVFDETSVFSAALYPAEYTQYFYTEVMAHLDGTTLGKADWRITVHDPSSDPNYPCIFMLWVNGVLQGVRNDIGGAATFQGVKVREGANSILFSRTVNSYRFTDEENCFSFHLDQSDGTWHSNDSVIMLIPRSNIMRTPLVYCDENQTTGTITRENEAENTMILDLDVDFASYNGINDFIMDYSGKVNRHGIIHGASWDWWSGELQFDGVGDYIEISYPGLALDMTGKDLTISMTTNLNQFSDEYDVLFGINTYAGTDRMFFGIGSGGVMTVFDGSDWNDVGTTDLRDDTWHWLTWCYDISAQIVDCYVDGVKEGTATGITSTISGADRISIGQEYDLLYPPITSNEMNGWVRSVDVFNRLLQTQEIVNLMLDEGDVKEDLVNTPRMLANEVMGTLAASGIHAVVGGTNRLINYIDTDIEMTKGSAWAYTTWHPFGSVILTHDFLPKEVFDGNDNSPIEQFLEAGGKLTTAPGYVPFSWYSEYGGITTWVTGPESSYGYLGAYGHQLVFDIDDDNSVNGTAEDRDDFEHGLFFSDEFDDDYGATVDLPSNSGTYSEGTGPPSGETVNNLGRYNYEPFIVGNPAFTQLPHTGYTTHMALSRAEYDTVKDYYDDTYYHSVYNGDGRSGTYSAEASNSTVGDLYYGSYTLDLTTSPLDAVLWFKPYLYDEYGVYQHSYANSYLSFIPGIDGDPLDATFYHHERAVPGVGSVQGGKNAKGIVNVAPMINWNERLSGLDNDDTKSYHRGKFADRGYGSLTNSPTTELMARNHLVLTLSEMMVTMTLESIIVNTCRDNSTIGNNFLNFGSETRVANHHYYTTGMAQVQGSPLTYGWKLDANENDGYLKTMGEYPIFGGEHGRGIANASTYDYDLDVGDMSEKQNTWSKMTYGLAEGSTIDYVEFFGKRDGLITLSNVDNQLQEWPYAHKIGLDAPTALMVEGMMHDGESNINSDLSVAVTPLKVYNGAGMVYSSLIPNPSSTYQYNVGVGDDGDDALRYLHVNVDGGVTIANIPWDIYNQDHSDYNDVKLGYWYKNSDTELVLRNSEIANYDLTDAQFNWQNAENARYFQPVIFGHDPETSGPFDREMDILYSENSTFTTSSSGTVDISSLYDDDLSTVGYLEANKFDDNDGWCYDPAGPTMVSIVFTDGTHDLTGMMFYQHATKTLREVSISLFDTEGNITFSQIYSLPESQRVGGDKIEGASQDPLRPGQPTYIPFPQEISGVERVDIRCHRKFEEDLGSYWEYTPEGGFSEIEIFGDSLQQPEVHTYENFEAVDRLSDVGADNILECNQYCSDEILDNGDDVYDEEGDLGFVSGPRQQGSFRVDVYNRRNQSEIKSMRWQLGYSSFVITTSEFPSMADYEIMNAPEIEAP